MEIGTILSGIEGCWKVGNVLIEYCQAWKSAENEVSDRVTIIECAWNRTRLQLEFVQRLVLDEEHRRILDDLVRIFALKLSHAITTINRTLKEESEKRPGFFEFPHRAKRAKYALLKSTIDQAICEVEEWQRRFDPSWFLVMRSAGPALDDQIRNAKDQELRNASLARSAIQTSSPTAIKRYSRPTFTPLAAVEGLRTVLRPDAPRPSSIFLPQIEFESRPIQFSAARTARSRSQPGAPWYILDTIFCRPYADPNILANDIRILVRKLTKADPLAFGLLNCKGAIRNPGTAVNATPPSFDLVFRPPDGFEVLTSLRQFLLEQHQENRTVSLSRRVAIAKELVRSVFSVHTFQFVHKNVRPESVLLLEDVASRSNATFLVGFDNFRAADGATNLSGDVDWERNIYRHPSRQGDYPEERYKMQHDIYSLGVCLLELGLQESFVAYDAARTPQPGARFADFNTWLESSGHSTTWGFAQYLKDYFEHLACSRLPELTGEKYSQVVLTCLGCLDGIVDDVGNVGNPVIQNEISTGMKFIQKVLLHINEIVL